MGLLNIIRRMHLRQKLSIREIARLTGVWRNTVTRHLAANTIEPQFATPERQSKIAPFADTLAGWLKAEGGKSRKQKRTVQQLHADLVTLGFFGSLSQKRPLQVVAGQRHRWAVDVKEPAFAANIAGGEKPDQVVCQVKVGSGSTAGLCCGAGTGA